MSENKQGLLLSDLETVIKIIDLSAKRGVFSGEDLTIVGGLRERISGFINTHKPKTEEHADETNDKENS